MNKKIILLKVVLAVSLLNFNLFGQESIKTVIQNPVSILKADRWTPVSIDNKKVQSAKLFIQFDLENKRFSGNAGCNRMFGSFQIDRNEIKFSKVGTTKMLCPEKGMMQLESNFINALEKVDRFVQMGNMLRLYAGDKLVLKLFGTTKDSEQNQKTTITKTNLEGRKWALTQVAGNASSKTKTTPFIVFNRENKTAAGNAGCNSFGGSYNVDSSRINIVQTVATQRACIDSELMNTEQEFLQALQQVNRFEITDKKLYLYENTKLLLVFREQETE